MVVTSSGAGQRHVADPSPAELVAAIQALEGAGEVELDAPGRGWLGVAGGPRQYLVGFARASDEAIQQARGAERGGGSAEMVIGGQPSSIAAEYTVTLEAATAAALHFCREARRIPPSTGSRCSGSAVLVGPKQPTPFYEIEVSPPAPTSTAGDSWAARSTAAEGEQRLTEHRERLVDQGARRGKSRPMRVIRRSLP